MVFSTFAFRLVSYIPSTYPSLVFRTKIKKGGNEKELYVDVQFLYMRSEIIALLFSQVATITYNSKDQLDSYHIEKIEQRHMVVITITEKYDVDLSLFVYLYK